ncbi:hypothetical protein GWK47_042439 [Chionoecetes opilio]|uniref:Secreted protein n=1 Tax=Chionoecetes opilio TaxID=41210 RepID=A0A8J5CWD3_CHIOP|nr:hypothetical protein GWK47_042439 [Chionoecetes opilio]
MLVPLGSVRLVLVVAVVVVTGPSPTQAAPFDLGGLLTGVLGTLVKDAFKTQEITLLDRYCTLSRRAYISRAELHYKAVVSCPGWTTIRGEGCGARSGHAGGRGALARLTSDDDTPISLNHIPPHPSVQ